MSITDLARFREDGPTPSPPALIGPSVTLAPMAPWEGTLLALDQSLGKTGWVLVEPTSQGLVFVTTGMCKTEPTGVKGYGDYMLRATDLARQIKSLLNGHQPGLVVHEEPPMGSGLHSPDSSLVAATVIRSVADLLDFPVAMVHAKRAKKHITGNGNADKKQVHSALREHYPHLMSMKPMNQDIYDAVAIAVTYATGGQ